MRKRYIWQYNVLKATEGGQGSAIFKRILYKKSGIKAITSQSSYVGRTCITAITNTLADMRRALWILKEYGYIKSIQEGLNSIEER